MYTEIWENVQRLAEKAGRDPHDIRLVVVTKGRTVEEIQQAYNQGCRDFGENRVQEALPKIALLPSDINWHFIGTLQKNKVSKVIDKFSLIHSIDSIALVHEISTTPLLLQVNTSGELTKHGLSCDEWLKQFPDQPNVKGLMTIAPLTQDKTILRSTFRALRHLRDELVERSGHPLPHLSMGMSNDYPIAIEEGATLLRIGTAIFAK